MSGRIDTAAMRAAWPDRPLPLCDEVDLLRELLRRHVMDWGECDTECCPCSHRQALDYLKGVDQ